jgi:hypothetical protein
MTVFVYVNTAKQVGDKDHIRSSPRSMPPPRRGGVTNLSHAAHYGALCVAAIVAAMIRCICRNGSKDDSKSDLAHI